MDIAALKNCTERQKQMVFLAIVFIIVVIVALMSPDILTTIAIIGGLLGFYAAFMAAGAGGPLGAPAAKCTGAACAKEGYSSSSEELAPPPYLVATAAADGVDDGADDYQGADDLDGYQGAIDLDDYDSEAEYGHRDRTEGDNAGAPEGNPFNRGRISAPSAADSCIDDEANDGEMDADELNTYQARSRNDAERVTAGTMNRRRDMDKYFREEVEEAEDRIWWGRGEV